MWIEYELNFKGEVREKGMFNSDHIKWIQIEQHGGGYGQALEMYYDGYDSKCVFIADDKDAVAKVWIALQNALAGVPSSVTGIGFIGFSRWFLFSSPRRIDSKEGVSALHKLVALRMALRALRGFCPK